MVVPPTIPLPYFGMQHSPPAPYRHEMPSSSSSGSTVHYHPTPHNYFLDPQGRPYMYNPTTQSITNRPTTSPAPHTRHSLPRPTTAEWRSREALEGAITVGPAPVEYGFGYGPRVAQEERTGGFVRAAAPPSRAARPPVLYRRPQYEYQYEPHPATARKPLTRDENNRRISAFSSRAAPLKASGLSKHNRQLSGEKSASRRDSRSLRRTRDLSSTTSSASSYPSSSSSSSSSSSAVTPRPTSSRRETSKPTHALAPRHCKSTRSRRVSETSSSHSLPSSSSRSSSSAASSFTSDHPSSSSSSSSSSNISRSRSRGRSRNKRSSRRSRSASASSSPSSSFSSSLSSSSSSSAFSSRSSSRSPSPSPRVSRRSAASSSLSGKSSSSSSSRSSTPRRRSRCRTGRRESSTRSPPTSARPPATRRLNTSAPAATSYHDPHRRNTSTRNTVDTSKPSYHSTDSHRPQRANKRTPTERLLHNLSHSHGISLQPTPHTATASLTLHDQRIHRTQAGLHHARVTADPLARITPPLPYFHSSTVPAASEWRSGCHPSLQNMSLHEALQLRELLRTRVRALHAAHTDALEGLRRRQWEIEKGRQAQEAYDSTYPSEWTRQQYEEMQPLQDEQQYEYEQEEGEEETVPADIPLTVPSLSPYWYERKDAGFCEQLTMYKNILADLDQTFFS